MPIYCYCKVNDFIKVFIALKLICYLDYTMFSGTQIEEA